MNSIESHLNSWFDKPSVFQTQQRRVQKFHESHLELINDARGSNTKHHSWTGGYRDHIEQCLDLAFSLVEQYNFGFYPKSVFLVLYFHDIEKIFKYSVLPRNQEEAKLAIEDKDKYYNQFLPQKYKIAFTSEEKNALKYIHGEGDDYGSEKIMNSLAGLCHACDTMSARCFFSARKI
ncbi:MAG: hypothetical protein DWQ19_09955 [Crenarchaeota archaeon]|nr:MAG: hypothetical protein DWQ19_09955 [Thermoproteota archaeon]